MTANTHRLAASFHDNFEVTTIGRRIGKPHATVSRVAVVVFVKTGKPSESDFDHRITP